MLHDGENPVARVCVMCLVKNNEKWVRYAAPRLDQMVALYPATTFKFFFYENDSDDATPELVRAFVDRHPGSRLFKESRPSYRNLGVNYDRTKAMSDMRNRLLDLVHGCGGLVDAQWCMFLDSNIFFAPSVVQNLFDEAKPASNNIVMVTPYASEIMPVEVLRAKGVPISESVRPGALVGFEHYYDTFAFVDADGRNFWPRCPFARCKMCKISSVSDDASLLDVRSSFGGLCIVAAQALRHPAVRWCTTEFAGKFALCEHVGFCHALRVATGGRVVIATRVTDVRWLGV